MDKKGSKSKYQKPDPLWEVLDINSFEKYELDCIIKGRFHSDVPIEVVEAYKAAEYIMAQAYYYYPLLDDAAEKLFKIMEMAIKIKSKKEKIKLKNVNIKTGRFFYLGVKELITKLKDKGLNEGIVRSLNQVRTIRNEKTHQDKVTLQGIVAMNIYYQMVNLLNELFVESHYFDEKQEKLLSSEKTLREFQNGLFVLDHSNNKYLIQGAKPISCDIVKDKWVSYWAAHPIYLNFTKVLRSGVLDPPMLIVVQNFEIIEDRLHGKDIKGNQLIISKTDENDNIEKYNTFVAEQNCVSDVELNAYRSIISAYLASELMKFRYWNCW